jgi:hypothetical protein
VATEWELNGLRSLIGNGTLHSIQAPPDRDDFNSDEAYSRAYDEWWIAVHCWRSTTKGSTQEP